MHILLITRNNIIKLYANEKFKRQIESIDNKTIKNALYKLINTTK